MYNMKEGKQECLEEETLEESESSADTSSFASESTSQSSSECDSSIEICGVTLKDPSVNGGEIS